MSTLKQSHKLGDYGKDCWLICHTTMTIGKDDEEIFLHHINNEFFDGDEDTLISMGVTDW